LAARIAALGAVSPCVSCEAPRLHHALDAARRTRPRGAGAGWAGGMAAGER